ncbi:MAG: hypothetical protein Q9164_007060 [Protoblastenia rupestris]
MSIDIDWDTLTSGPTGQELADSIRNFIHDKFQQVQLPRFIRSVEVHSFNFGNECPIVELKDITDPLPDFYDDDENDEEEETGPENEGERQSTFGSLMQSDQQPRQASTAPSTHQPTYIDTHLPNLRPNSCLPDQITTPFLSRSNTTTPGIPSHTSNLGYFHLPLSAGLSGTHTPLSGATPFTPLWPDHPHHNRPPSPVKTHQQPQHPFADPTSRPSTARSHPLSPEQQPLSEPQSPTSPSNPLDMQTTLHISYTGSLSLSLTAEILLDYPMPSFVGIPLKLNITGLSFDGVALLAYLRGKERGKGAETTNEEGSKGKIKFCFLGPEDARMMLGSEDGLDGDGDMDKKPVNEGKLGGLLKEIRVESEIGRQEDGKQVLKNVGKVERFVLEQVRRIFEDEFVFPSFWTFLV